MTDPAFFLALFVTHDNNKNVPPAKAPSRANIQRIVTMALLNQRAAMVTK